MPGPVRQLLGGPAAAHGRLSRRCFLVRYLASIEWPRLTWAAFFLSSTLAVVILAPQPSRAAPGLETLHVPIASERTLRESEGAGLASTSTPPQCRLCRITPAALRRAEDSTDGRATSMRLTFLETHQSLPHPILSAALMGPSTVIGSSASLSWSGLLLASSFPCQPFEPTHGGAHLSQKRARANAHGVRLGTGHGRVGSIASPRPAAASPSHSRLARVQVTFRPGHPSPFHWSRSRRDVRRRRLQHQAGG